MTRYFPFCRQRVTVPQSLVLCTLFLAAMGFEFGKGEVGNWREERNVFLSGAGKEHEREVDLFLPRVLGRAGGLDLSGRYGCRLLPSNIGFLL